jgi:PilZ domain
LIAVRSIPLCSAEVKDVPMSAHPASDRRAHPRYLCWVEALATTEEHKPQPARLLDLSASGARVALLRQLPLGANLRLTLPRSEGLPSVLEATISRVIRTRTGWEAGCTFDPPLSDEQLAALLQSIEVG